MHIRVMRVLVSYIQEQYFELYKYTSLAFKQSSPHFRVGGPAVSCLMCLLRIISIPFVGNISWQLVLVYLLINMLILHTALGLRVQAKILCLHADCWW